MLIICQGFFSASRIKLEFLNIAKLSGILPVRPYEGKTNHPSLNYTPCSDNTLPVAYAVNFSVVTYLYNFKAEKTFLNKVQNQKK